MITYLLKSASCLALLLVFYHLVLEREKMHNFNRFYLLGSVLFSFLAPLFIIYITVPAEETFTTIPIVTEQFSTTNSEEYIEPINYTQYLLLFSLTVSTILSIRFIKNLISIALKIKQNEKIVHQKATLILVNDKITPHTFWNYIFINKDEYNSKKIEQELFTHELTHATQKHTLDVLLIEALKIVFWFNPIFYFLKKSIQLNHEFLADTNVINNHKNISEYQYLLLNKTAWNNEYYLASNLNYLLTKKRLQMMTKQSSQTKILLKKLAVIPLLVGFVFLFAERVEAQEDGIEEIVEEIPINKYKVDDSELYKEYYYRNGIITRTDKNGKKISKKYSELTDEEKKNVLPPPPIKTKKKIPSKKLIQNLKNSKEYALWIDGKVVNNLILNDYKNSDFSNYFVSFVHKNARSKRFPQNYQANLYTHTYLKNQNKKRANDFSNYLKNKHNIQTIVEQPLIVSIEKYKVLNDLYNGKRNQKPHYVKSSKKRQRELDNLFSKLGSMYFKLSKADKRRVKRPIHPFKPYLKLKKNNKVFYKLEGEMTEEDKLLIPPPPPRPNASKEEKDRAKRAYLDWKKRTGNDGAPPPQKPKIKEVKLNGKKQGVIPPPPPLKKGASQKEIDKYNKAYKNWKNDTKKNHLPLKKTKEVKPVKIEVKNKPKVKEIKVKNSKSNQEMGSIDKIDQLNNKEILALPKLKELKKVKYYLDNKPIAIDKLDKKKKMNQIKEIHVKKESDGSSSIYITSK